MAKYDSISRDKNGKVLVVVVDGVPITDQKEIRKIISPPKKEIKDD